MLSHLFSGSTLSVCLFRYLPMSVYLIVCMSTRLSFCDIFDDPLSVVYTVYLFVFLLTPVCLHGHFLNLPRAEKSPSNASRAPRTQSTPWYILVVPHVTHPTPVALLKGPVGCKPLVKADPPSHDCPQQHTRGPRLAPLPRGQGYVTVMLCVCVCRSLT